MAREQRELNDSIQLYKTSSAGRTRIHSLFITWHSLVTLIVRSPNRTHDRLRFFKYASADTAKAILANRSLRWSSPILLNDPFDVPREMSFGLTPSHIAEALTRRISDLIEHPPEDTSELEPQLRCVVDGARNGVPSELKVELLKDLKTTMVLNQPVDRGMEALRAMWRDLLSTFRILCLTESPNHLAMWYHYADHYRGTVLEFRCDDGLDSAWLVVHG